VLVSKESRFNSSSLATIMSLYVALDTFMTEDSSSFSICSFLILLSSGSLHIGIAVLPLFLYIRLPLV
jgi:hypothetical protein